MRLHVTSTNCKFAGYLRTSCGVCNAARRFNGTGAQFHAAKLAAGPWQLYRGLSSSRSRTIDEFSDKEGILDSFKKTLVTRVKTTPWPELHRRTQTDESERVQLYGYVGHWSHLSKKLSFATLRSPSLDRSVQLISIADQADPDGVLKHRALRSLRPHSPVYVAGILRTKLETKDGAEATALDNLEICISGPGGHIECLNEFPVDIVLKPETQFSASQRHLQLRNDFRLREALAVRADVQNHCRAVLRNLDTMTEIETPLLFKSTSEGAREFLVPTRRKGWAYALPQSPQQFKQILMASGVSGYFQFAKCFRDEDLRADRQPEFTQKLDMEVAFASASEIMAMTENIIRLVWQRFLSVELPVPFPQMSYSDAMSGYGSDKPDLRIPFPAFQAVGHMLPVDLINMLTKIKEPKIEALIVPLDCKPQESWALIKSLLDSVEGQAFRGNDDGPPGIFVFDTSKPLNGLSAFGFEAAENLEGDFSLENGHLVVLQARQDKPHTGGSTSLGDLRKAVFKAAVNAGHLSAHAWNDFKPLWVVDFPLFSPSDTSEPGQGGRAGICSTHHPFTSPKTPQDVDVLLSDPLKAVGDHYDLVINGEEIGGGSRRIHQAPMQELIFRNIVGMEEGNIDQFSHLLEALHAGCPPHAGIALGFDRLVAMIMSSKSKTSMSMRDVIAFPKTGKGDDAMVNSPGEITQQALETYHLQLRGK